LKNCFFYISRMYEFLHSQGHERTRATSARDGALPPKADIERHDRHVRSVPKADIRIATNCSLFDHLVDAGEHGRGNIEAERLCGLEVEHRLIPCRRLHRQIGWFLTLENAVNVTGRAPVLVDVIRAVGDQAASANKVTFEIDCWQFVASGNVDRLDRDNDP